MADGFLGRWARRKADAREGKPLEEPVRAPAPAVAAPTASAAPAPAAPPAHAAPAVAEPPAPPPPTLQEAEQLTPESDFRRFVARDVPPEVRNTAVKKLFADPHFNVMDGLDIYIDDYNKPDPLPAAMLKQLASARFMGLFNDDPETPAAATPHALQPSAAAAPEDSPSTPEPVAAPVGALPAPASQDHHADPDLRLQPDDAPRRESAGHRAA